MMHDEAGAVTASGGARPRSRASGR
jgi:hypothetical protein